MSLQISNEYGNIKIDNEVIARMAGITSTECYGVVGMAARNVKDGLVQLLKRESLSKGVRLNINNNKAIIDLHIIVEYGTNIPAISKSLVDAVKYRVEEFIGLDVEQVNVFVEGIRIDK